MPDLSLDAATIPDALQELVSRTFPGEKALRCAQLVGGRNNRVFRVETTRRVVAAKHYFSGGDWDRMEAEKEFLLFCRGNAIRWAPGFLAESRGANLALHEWMEGDPLKSETITTDHVRDAAAFAGALYAASRDAGNRPPARDACLSLDDFFRSPRQRVRELADALAGETHSEPVRAEAADFVGSVLVPKWKRAKNAVLGKLGRAEPTERFDSRLLFVSPSDFGFHNALRSNGGELRFLDFEYAGLDSVVKAIADFVCQPSLPPPAGAANLLVDAVAETRRRGDELTRILDAILPLVRIKFCCIILNDFKRDDSRRRDFSLGAGTEKRLAGQLDKARKYARAFLDA